MNRTKHRLLPAWLLDHLRCLRNLPLRSRVTYVRVQLRRWLSRRSSEAWPNGPLRSILFVCHGNIIRSPMAAALLRQHLHSRSVEHVIVASAGLWAVPGRGADPRALLIAREFGLSLNDHRAHPLTPELVQASEAICVMDYLNEAELVARFPAAERKVFLLGAMDRIDRGGQVEIPDPYDGDLSDVRRCYQALDSKIRKLADRIKAALPGAPEQS